MLCILSNNNWALENLALCSPGSMSQGSLEGKIAVTSDSVSSGVLAATFPALAQRLREGCSRGQARAWLPSACGSPALSRPLHTLLSFLRSNSAGRRSRAVPPTVKCNRSHLERHMPEVFSAWIQGLPHKTPRLWATFVTCPLRIGGCWEVSLLKWGRSLALFCPFITLTKALWALRGNPSSAALGEPHNPHCLQQAGYGVLRLRCWPHCGQDLHWQSRGLF